MDFGTLVNPRFVSPDGAGSGDGIAEGDSMSKAQCISDSNTNAAAGRTYLMKGAAPYPGDWGFTLDAASTTRVWLAGWMADWSGPALTLADFPVLTGSGGGPVITFPSYYSAHRIKVDCNGDVGIACSTKINTTVNQCWLRNGTSAYTVSTNKCAAVSNLVENFSGDAFSLGWFCLVAGNFFRDITGRALYNASGWYAVVNHNIFARIGGDGAEVGNLSQLHHNTFFEVDDYAIQSTTGSSVHANIFHTCGTDVGDAAVTGASLMPNSDNIYWPANTTIATTTGKIGNIGIDPAFEDSDDDNFKPTALSPLISEEIHPGLDGYYGAIDYNAVGGAAAVQHLGRDNPFR